MQDRHRVREVPKPNRPRQKVSPPKNRNRPDHAKQPRDALDTKKTSSKAHSRQAPKSKKNSLFNSVEELPLKNGHINERMNQKLRQMGGGASSSGQESSTSREGKSHAKGYNLPNGQYFGGKPFHSKKDSNHLSKSKSSNKSQRKSSSSGKRKEIKLGELRGMWQKHETQLHMAANEVSERELRRLRKLQSLEKLQLMEEIINNSDYNYFTTARQ